MTIFAYTIERYRFNGTFSHKACGIVKAKNIDEATNLIWDKVGSNYSCNLMVYEAFNEDRNFEIILD